MAAIWTNDNRFRIMLRIETLAAEAMEAQGTIPAGTTVRLAARTLPEGRAVVWRVSGAVLIGALAALATGVPSVRRELLTRRILPLIAPILPKMSDTEKVAIEAGTVGWEAEFFTGKPAWKRLLSFQPKELTKAEQAFLDGVIDRGEIDTSGLTGDDEFLARVSRMPMLKWKAPIGSQ